MQSTINQLVAKRGKKQVKKDLEIGKRGLLLHPQSGRGSQGYNEDKKSIKRFGYKGKRQLSLPSAKATRMGKKRKLNFFFEKLV